MKGHIVKFNISIENISNSVVSIGSMGIDVDYTAEEVIAIIGAYKDFVPVILAALKDGNISI